ncbi:hypothetical protein BV898_12834 [Hypsibius exemplaris]|uniref:LisH domain-containing protein n=1 Tax=Hypsibius exemplaris TaxID=2072580 RepID=A0A1W0WCM1_HYPEX|nr:hypothetical protein BV898_12834 [Hypsibius exemplaris]
MARDYSGHFWHNFADGHSFDEDGPRNGAQHSEEETEEKDDADREDFDALRERLIAQLESPQFNGRLKAQVRSSLVLQLTPHDVLTAKPPGQKTDPLRELANAVVAQHLADSGCDFSLSVFLPESGLNRDLHPMSLPSLLAYLRVKYSNFRVTEQRSLLSVLIGHLPVAEDAISASFANAFAKKNAEALEGPSRATQTDSTVREQDVMQLELQWLEMKTKLGWRRGERFVVEEALARFRTEVADETRTRVFEDAMRNKEADIRHAVEEERHRHARELLSVSGNWEAKMQDQEAKLGILQQRLQLAEQKAFVERQTLLQQQETLAERDSQQQHVFDTRLKELGEKEQELVTRAKQVAEFSKALQTREAGIQRTVDLRVGELVRLRAKVLDEREEQLKKDEAALNKLKEHLTRTILSESGEPDVTASVEPKPFLHKIKSEFSRLHRENQKLKTRLATIADYETLKSHKADSEREVKMLRGQVSALQRCLQEDRQEHTAMIRELTEKVVQPDHNAEAYRREAESARDKLLLEGLRWDAEKGKLKATVKDRGREIDRLRDRLAQLQEKYESVNGKLTRMQELSSQAAWMMTHPQAQPAAPIAQPQVRLRLPVLQPDSLSGDESSSSLHSISDAKKRIKALEEEANSMQAHFVQYRRYVTTQFQSSPPIHLQPATSSASSSFVDPTRTGNATTNIQNVRTEAPRKLLLTQYLIQDGQRPSTGAYNGASSLNPPKVVSGLSGGDLGMNARSLEVELREAEEGVRMAEAPGPKEEDFAPLKLDVESKIDADVRELMASVDVHGDLDGEDVGW